MSLRTTFLILLVGYSIFCSSQEKVLDWTEYFTMINKADSLYDQNKFLEAADQYSKAFEFNRQGYSLGDKYKAAKAYAKAGQIDLAILNLKDEVESGFSRANKLKKENAFKILHKTPQWKVLLQAVVLNEKKEADKLGKYRKVKERLETIFVLDQKYRDQYQQTIDSFGMASKEVRELMEKMKSADKRT